MLHKTLKIISLSSYGADTFIVYLRTAIMVFFFSGLSVLYCTLLLWLVVHWCKIPTSIPPDQPPVATLPSLAVVIPVRNEATTIQDLLQDLNCQTNLVGKALIPEVIVVDDASTDNTAQLVRSFSRTAVYPLRLLSLRVPPGFDGSHKKLALQQAIEATQSEIIVTTDGDCRVGPQWLFTIAHHFARHHSVLVSGPVTFCCEATLFEQLQTVEFASLIGTGAACLRAGWPTMCNGANLAFLRSAFHEVGGYAGTMHIPSGDDEFLLQKVARHYPRQLSFLKESEATVRTYAKKSVNEFYQQRKRWAGKWKLHRNYWVATLAIFIFSYHLSVLIVGGEALYDRYPKWVLFIQLLPKVLLEYFFLRSVLHAMKKPLNAFHFLLMQLIYAPYAVFFGLRANFGGYTWKNRTYR